MKINISSKIKLIVLITGLGLTLAQPAKAVLEGPLRDQMEYLDFSERLIHAGLYPKSSHDVYDKEKRAYVHGIKRHNAPVIYEPDVYTWELAMAEHKKQLAQKSPEPVPVPIAPPPAMSPAPMSPPPVLPDSPQPVQLTPIGPQTAMESPNLPNNSQQNINKLIYHARANGIYPNRPLRAEELKEKLLKHLKSLSKNSASTIPALMPALPAGHKGDSFDANY